MRSHLALILVGVLSLLGAGPGFGAEAAQPVAGEFKDAGALLDALETADQDIGTFHAQIIYDRFFNLQGDRHIRGGDLYFKVSRVPGRERPIRTFGVHFDWLQLDGAKREERQAWIFNGEWLVEKRFADKQYVARQITRPGEQIDPLRLGEGPLPIPIGQRKADILARYMAEVLPADAGFDPENADHMRYLSAVRGATQLHLTPRPERAERDEFQSIRIWYRRDSEGILLPVLSRTVDRKGDESFVLLANVEVNKPIPAGKIDVDPPAEGQGWDVQYERLRADEKEGPAGENRERDVTPQAEAANDED